MTDSGPDVAAELAAAFRRYVTTGVAPAVSDDALGDVAHGLRKAVRNAASLGEDVDLTHHPMFALWAVTIGHPERIPDFLTAIRTEAAGSDEGSGPGRPPPPQTGVDLTERLRNRLDREDGRLRQAWFGRPDLDCGNEDQVDADDLLVLGHADNPLFAGLRDAIVEAGSGGDARMLAQLRLLSRWAGPWLAYRLDPQVREITARGRPDIEGHDRQVLSETRDHRHASGLVPLIVFFPDDPEPVHTTGTIRPSPR